MNRYLKTAVAGVLLSAAVTTAHAAMVQLGSVNKNYGSNPGRSNYASNGGSCDTLNAASVTIRDSSNCQRFYDVFDFSSLNYTSLDHLTLTLSFTNTNGFLEDWQMRFAESATVAGGNRNMNDVGSGGTSQAFTLNAANGGSIFTNVATNKQLYLWFADEGALSNNFNLVSARLDVFGTAVPEPASMALFGIALGALGVARRRKTR